MEDRMIYGLPPCVLEAWGVRGWREKWEESFEKAWEKHKVEVLRMLKGSVDEL